MSKRDRDWTMPVLIAFNKGEWTGYELLMRAIERMTSVCSIPKYELFKKVLKEYHKYRSIYDMDHNSPSLLICRMLSLAKTCTMLTVPQTELDIRNIMSDITLPYHANSRYPILPNLMLEHLGKLFDDSTMYIDKNILGPDQSFSDIKEIFIRNFSISYFSNWQNNIVEPRPWILLCIEQILLVIPDNSKLACSNLINRSAEEIAKDPRTFANTTSMQPSIVSRFWYALGFR